MDYPGQLHHLAAKLRDPYWAAVCRESAGEIICLYNRIAQLENEVTCMGKEANIVNFLNNKVSQLEKLLADAPPAVPADHVKDDADVAAEAGFNDDGTPKTPAA